MSWILHDQAGQWTDGQSTIDIDLKSSPRIRFSHLGEYVWGMAIAPECSSSSSGSSTAVSPTHAASDHYVRGNDLVAAYAERAPLTYAYQVYFSIVPSLPGTIALELWLSVQTSTLEAHPVLNLSAEGELGECKALAHPGVLRLRDNKAGIVIHPLDQREVTIEADGQQVPHLRAFGSFMEKGVIRRMRIQLITSQNALSQDDWHKISSAFSVSPLPLTA
jgi:hypothetical protein